jgi:hypothetical protein
MRYSFFTGSSIKHIPISGRDITYFVQSLLREREPNIPPEQSLETAKAIKVDCLFLSLSLSLSSYFNAQAKKKHDWPYSIDGSLSSRNGIVMFVLILPENSPNTTKIHARTIYNILVLILLRRNLFMSMLATNVFLDRKYSSILKFVN